MNNHPPKKSGSDELPPIPLPVPLGPGSPPFPSPLDSAAFRSGRISGLCGVVWLKLVGDGLIRG